MRAAAFFTRNQVLAGGQPVTHNVDPKTGLTIIQKANGNFLSGWKLSADQLRSVLKQRKAIGVVPWLAFAKTIFRS